MVIQGSRVTETRGRKLYPIDEQQDILHHFAAFTTTPDNPFRPHKHERAEIWYIVEGQGLVSLDGQEQPVEAGDLVILASRVEHGLRTDGQVQWICLG